MLSNKNVKEYFYKQQPKKQRFTIKKLTVGVASVLIGFTFMGVSAANADKVTPVPTNVNNAVSLDNFEQTTTKDANQSEVQSSEAPESATANSNVASQQANSVATTTQAVAPTKNDQATNSQVVASTVNTTVHVNDATEFQTALSNTNVNQIVLDNSLTNNNQEYNIATDPTSGRNLVIAGSYENGTSPTIGLGQNSFNVAENPTNLNLTFKNLTFNTNNNNGIVTFSKNNGTGANVNFENVTDQGSGILVNATGVNVNLANVTANTNSNTANVTANNVTVGDNVNLGTTQNAGNINAAGNVTINGKNVKLTSNVTNDSASSNIIVNGTLQVNSGADAILTANSSQGINISNISAGNLNLVEGSTLTVNANTTASGISTPDVYYTNLYPNGSNAVILNNGGAEIDGNLTINANSKNSNSSGIVAGLAVNSPSSSTAADVVVGQTGNLVVNATNSRNTRGVAFLWSDGGSNGSNHNFGILENGHATFKMGHGVSNALWNPDNVVLKDGASLIIDTLQDSNGNTNNGIQSDGAGVHSGPITMSFWPNVDQNDNSTLVPAGTHATIDVNKDATLRIIRSMDNESQEVGSPLITYGGNGSNTFKMTLNVNGGIFDLEDAMQYNSYDGILDSHQGYLYNGDSNNQYVIYPMGMVAMFGTGAPSQVNITDPELFKMVRTGKQQGMLFRLEGYWNQINWKSSTGKYIPIEYSTLANVAYNDGTVSKAASYNWNIINASSSNVEGNGSMNYYNSINWNPSFGNAQVFNINNGNLSPATVTFKDGTSTVDEQNFKQFFNYWSATNLEAGTDLLDNHLYQPRYANSTVRQGGIVSVDPTYPSDPQNPMLNPENKAPKGTTYTLGKDAITWATIDKTTGEITFKPANDQPAKAYMVPVVVTFPDGTAKSVTAEVTVTESDANKYAPKGREVSIIQNTPVAQVISDAPKGIDNPADLPTNTKYNWKVTPDVTKPGKVPATVIVTYPDGSSEEVPTNIIVDAVPKVGSLTTEVGKTINLNDPAIAKTAITNLNDGGDKPVTGYPMTVKWVKAPDTAKAGLTTGEVSVTYPDGTTQTATIPVNVIGVESGIDHPDDSSIYDKITRTVNIEGQAKPIIQQVVYTRTKYTDLAKPVDQQVTYSKWTPEYDQDGKAITTFAQVNVTKNGYTAHATGDASIKIINGQEYVPASGEIVQGAKDQVVDVTYTANEHQLLIKYVNANGDQIGTYQVNGKTDQNVAVEVANHVPTNWQLVPGQNVITSYQFGPENPQAISYQVEPKTEIIKPAKGDENTYREINEQIIFGPAGTNQVQNNINTNVIFTRTGTKNLVTGDVTYTDWQDAAGNSSYTFKGMPINQFKGYTSYLNSRKAVAIPTITVNADSHNILYNVTYREDAATPLPYQKGQPGVNDAMNRYVTRKIIIYTPNSEMSRAAEPTIKFQTVHFTNKDDDGNSGYQDPVTGKITYNTSWHVAGELDQRTGSWNEYLAPEYKGYNANPAKLAQEIVEYNTPDTTVTINYTKQAPTPVPYVPGTPNQNDDSNLYVTRTIHYIVPTGEPAIADQVQTVHYIRKDAQGNSGYTDPVTGKVTYVAWTLADGQVAEWPEVAVDQIKNYDSFVDGQKASSVTAQKLTPETQNLTVTITYQAQDAIKYIPEGQPINTPVGTVPSPSAGIKNRDELPKGTTYTWTNPDQVKTDVNKVGKHDESITVTYPDGSKDTITVPVTVTKPSATTDADKYTPEGQPIETPTGTVPNPSTGIKNRDELPKGTTYTWENEPDVTTPGTHTGIIKVTFPDGSTCDVPVTVQVVSSNTVIANSNININGSARSYSTTGHANYANATVNHGFTTSDSIATENNNNTKKLPQTGNDASSTTLLGLGLAAVASLFGLGKKRRIK